MILSTWALCLPRTGASSHPRQYRGTMFPPTWQGLVAKMSTDPGNSLGKRDFAEVIKLRILRWQIILDYLGGLNVITRVPARGRQEDQSWDVTTEADAGVTRFEDGGRSQGRSTDALEGLVGRGASSPKPPEGVGPCGHLRFRTSDSITVR